MGLRLITQPRVFTIEDWNAWVGRPQLRLGVGTRIATNAEFSAFHPVVEMFGIVIGYNQNPHHEVSVEGYDIHETYQVRLDCGTEVCMWPIELNEVANADA